ncbi:DUF1934 domain-containing protein [Clostridium frigidicarnis]|uniref:Uncharacterized beta-barrel protein YwiB, DUF1934 family n=1 Tax=Clostridium frigidicarnis TaxID=84698 RepID=A0A1I0ZG98_9CLOT|nr:DUF1934 domain-containing protein [Clostridium frigidicarnis]SFB24146.1 Uncharacterized beta-barrel protein YwiB, DUF1934 family [Clostridium frigidicarnis]
MEKKAIISIKSSQDIDQDGISVVTPGEFFILDKGFKAVYKETELSGMEGTITTLNIFDKSVELIREGSTTALMNFEKGKENVSLYNTPYGVLELRTKTLQLDILVDNNGGKIVIEYEMSVQGQVPYKTNLEIEIK